MSFSFATCHLIFGRILLCLYASNTGKLERVRVREKAIQKATSIRFFSSSIARSFYFVFCSSILPFQLAIKKLINPNSYKFFYISLDSTCHVQRHICYNNTNNDTSFFAQYVACIIIKRATKSTKYDEKIKAHRIVLFHEKFYKMNVCIP